MTLIFKCIVEAMHVRIILNLIFVCVACCLWRDGE